MEFTATGLFLTLAGVLPDYRGAWGASIAGLVTDGQCGTALLALLRCWPQGDAHASWCCSPPARSHRPSGPRGPGGTADQICPDTGRPKKGCRRSSRKNGGQDCCFGQKSQKLQSPGRSEEHTSELQSLRHLVCRLLL